MRKLIIPFLFLVSVLSLNAQTTGNLTVTLTVAFSSPYYYSVWISNSSGIFLRTLVMYGNNSSYYKDLANWHS